jgi:hypothetical protein
MCCGDFGRDGAGPTKCGHGVQGVVDVYWVTFSQMLVVEMPRVTDLVVRVLEVAGVAVGGTNVVAWHCRGSHLRTGSGLCGGSGRGALASNRLGCVRMPVL